MTDPVASAGSSDPLTIRPIGRDQLADHVIASGGSYTQMPAWGDVKADWRREHLGWFDPAGTLVGAALVLYRSVPRTKRSFAYVANGPVLPWDEVGHNPARWLDPLAEHAKSVGAFALRIGCPGIMRIWTAPRVKTAMAEDGLLGFTRIEPDTRQPAAEALESWLARSGWTRVGWDTAVAVGQPRYTCVLDLAGRSHEDVLKGMNQQWRRNIKKAEKSGVEVRDAGAEGLDAFHEVYRETAERDGFMPRAKSYFDAIHRSYSAEPQSDVKIYEATLDGTVLASAVMVTTGETCSYLYGGSTTANREARASNALQWRAIRDAMADGCSSYDFRGFNTSVESSLPMTGLLQFKMGAGADVQELVGEHELVLNRLWHKAYELAMGTRMRINQRRFGQQAGADG